MDLLASYLEAIRVLLPKRHRDDIVAELSEELRSQIEEREEGLGRPLTPEEQNALFIEHGDPIDIARRYTAARRSLALGWELIGPELFTVYRLILAINISLAVLCTLGYALALHARVTVRMLAIPIVGQLICVTLTFVILNLVRRKGSRGWLFPPASLAPFQPIPRWVSIAGLVVWSGALAYWLALPSHPGLALGREAVHLRLTPVWDRIYLPALILLLLGLAQRAVNLVRPTWTVLVPVTRVVVNLGGVAVAWVLYRGYPFAIVAAGSDDPRYAAAAIGVNNFILWAVLSWVWIYFLINAAVHARFCLPYLQRLRLRRLQRS